MPEFVLSGMVHAVRTVDLWPNDEAVDVVTRCGRRTVVGLATSPDEFVEGPPTCLTCRAALNNSTR